DTRGDEDADLRAVTDLEAERGSLGRRALAQVVQHDPGPALRHVPVVRLVQVVVEADETAGLLVGTVALHHLAAVREPRSPVRLLEATALVAVGVRLDQPHAADRVGLVDGRHLALPPDASGLEAAVATAEEG